VVVFVAGVAAAALIWTHWVAPPTLIGEAEAVRTEVRSPQTGALARVTVKLLQPVRAGETIAQVITTDARVVEASLAVIRAELDSIRTTMDPVLGQQRAAIDYERLLLDLMNARVTLASLQSQLFQAESNYSRTSALYAGKLVTEERYEETKNARDALAAQVKAQLELIARVEPGLKGITGEGTDGKFPTPEQGLRAAIRIQEETLRLTEARLSPVALVAPMDGIVSQVLRREGETIAAGEPIFQISATGSTTVIGFVRQPIGPVLKAGVSVEVRTRSVPRQSGFAKIAQVGEQFEPIFPSLLAAMHLPVASIPTETGLRVLITAPEGLALRPGEHVDILLKE
jgi:multidrug resistance efflux pump